MTSPTLGRPPIAAIRDHPGAASSRSTLLVAVVIERAAVPHLATVCACNAGSAYPVRVSVPAALMWVLNGGRTHSPT